MQQACMHMNLQDVKSSKRTFINRTQQCFAVRSGVDGILDLARSTFCQVTEQVHELVDKYKTEYDMEALKVSVMAALTVAIARTLHHMKLPAMQLQMSSSQYACCLPVSLVILTLPAACNAGH